MKHIKFYAAFKEKLKEKMPSANSRSDWNDFSKLLQQQEGFENLDFDEKVKHQALKHTSSYSSDHWLRLKKRLEKEEQLHQHIYISKTIELFSVLLLVFTFIQYFLPDAYPIPGNIQPAKPLIERLGLAQTKVDVVNNSNHRVSKYKQAFSKQPGALVDFNETFLAAELKQNAVTAAEKIEGKKLLLPLYSAVKRNHELLLVLDTEPTSLPIIVPVSGASRSFLTPVASMGVAITKTPANITKDLESNSLFSTNFSAGFLYSRQFDNIEISSGINASKKNYSPVASPKTYVKDNVLLEETIDQITYDFASVPLHAKYLFPKHKDFTPFINAGIDVNLLLNAKYKLSLTELGRVNGLSANEGKPRIPQQESNPEGIINGGSLTNNLYLSLFAEAGVEKVLDPRNNITLGLSYSSYFNVEGLGPNRDQYDAISFNIGLKHSLQP